MNIVKLIKDITIPNHIQQINQEYQRRTQIKFTKTNFKDSTHLRSTTQGIQLEYIKNYLVTIFIYYKTNKISEFQGIVPFHIHKNSTIKSIIMYLGQPNKKSNKTIEMIYEDLGLGIVFVSTSWNKQDSLIQYLYLYNIENIDRCAGCGKNKQKIIFKCNKCKIVKYCSKDCIKKHYGCHLIFCQDVD